MYRSSNSIEVNAAREEITPQSEGGNRVVLDLGGGRFAAYAHLQAGSVTVRAGQRVRRGQPIAKAGSSGTTGGPHLHFQVRDRPSVLFSDGLPSRYPSATLRIAQMRLLASLAALALLTDCDRRRSCRHGEVTDGDTIRIGDARIRLWGIDAPERRQTCQGKNGGVYECGRDLAAVLNELTRGRRVECTEKDRDRYGRSVAVCRTETR